MTASQAAKRLGVTVRTLHRYELDGKVKPVRTLGGHRRYRPSELPEPAGA